MKDWIILTILIVTLLSGYKIVRHKVGVMNGKYNNLTPAEKNKFKRDALKCVRLLSDKYYFNEIDIDRNGGSAYASIGD